MLYYGTRGKNSCGKYSCFFSVIQLKFTWCIAVNMRGSDFRHTDYWAGNKTNSQLWLPYLSVIALCHRWMYTRHLSKEGVVSVEFTKSFKIISGKGFLKYIFQVQKCWKARKQNWKKTMNICTVFRHICILEKSHSPSRFFY